MIYYLFVAFIIAIGLSTLVRSTHKPLVLAVVSVVLRLFLIILAQGMPKIEVLVFSLAIIFIVNFIALWFLDRFEDSFIILILGVIALTAI